MPPTGEAQIRNTRGRISRGAACWLFATITAFQNSQELEDRRIFEKHLTRTERAAGRPGRLSPRPMVYAIAGTSDLTAKFAKVVVTDGRRRYFVPDLRRAN